MERETKPKMGVPRAERTDSIQRINFITENISSERVCLSKSDHNWYFSLKSSVWCAQRVVTWYWYSEMSGT